MYVLGGKKRLNCCPKYGRSWRSTWGPMICIVSHDDGLVRPHIQPRVYPQLARTLNQRHLKYTREWFPRGQSQGHSWQLEQREQKSGGGNAQQSLKRMTEEQRAGGPEHALLRRPDYGQPLAHRARKAAGHHSPNSHQTTAAGI